MNTSRLMNVGTFPISVRDHGVRFLSIPDEGTSIPYNATDEVICEIVRAYVKGMYLAYHRVVHSCTIPGVGGENVGADYRTWKEAHEKVWKE